MGCGPGLRPVGWPDTPATRCSALASVFSPRFAAIEDTAAWIWGVRRSPGPELRFSTLHGRAPAIFEAATAELPARWSHFRFEPADTTSIAGYAVTTVSRTVYDILRAERALTLHDHVACRLLLGHTGTTTAVLDRAGRGSRADRARVGKRLRQLSPSS